MSLSAALEALSACDVLRAPRPDVPPASWPLDPSHLVPSKQRPHLRLGAEGPGHSTGDLGEEARAGTGDADSCLSVSGSRGGEGEPRSAVGSERTVAAEAGDVVAGAVLRQCVRGGGDAGSGMETMTAWEGVESGRSGQGQWSVSDAWRRVQLGAALWATSGPAMAESPAARLDRAACLVTISRLAEVAAAQGSGGRRASRRSSGRRAFAAVETEVGLGVELAEALSSMAVARR